MSPFQQDTNLKNLVDTALVHAFLGQAFQNNAGPRGGNTGSYGYIIANARRSRTTPQPRQNWALEIRYTQSIVEPRFAGYNRLLVTVRFADLGHSAYRWGSVTRLSQHYFPR